MIFNQGNTTLIVSETVLSILGEHTQIPPRYKESGGILLGEVYHSEFQLTRISIPTQYDQKRKLSFMRDRRSAQIIIDYEQINSGGKTTYLGEWHTHPEDYPKPSRTDLRMIRDQYRKNIHFQKKLFLLIQGRKGLFAAYETGDGFAEMKNIKNKKQ